MTDYFLVFGFKAKMAHVLFTMLVIYRVQPRVSDTFWHLLGPLNKNWVGRIRVLGEEGMVQFVLE